MVSLFRRTRKLPADRRPTLEAEERVLAWAEVPAGIEVPAGGDVAGDPAGPPATDRPATVVVTNRGLWLPGELRRLGWHEIHKAVWSGRELAVTPAEVVGEGSGYAVVADRDTRTFLLLDPGEVPHQVRVRVSASVAYTSHHRLPDGTGCRVVARRVSGVDGLTWTVRFDPGARPGAGTTRDTVADLVAHARAEAGADVADR